MKFMCIHIHFHQIKYTYKLKYKSSLFNNDDKSSLFFIKKNIFLKIFPELTNYF